ncbi:MAG: hypothetical protein HDQ87_11500 [Clostridia bacterium]|nr:hypothetical protein [Clostridia bacterium]
MLQKKNSKDYEMKVFHEPDFEGWMEKLSAGDYRTVIIDLDKVIDGNTTFDTNQLHGHDFTSKVMPALEAVTGSASSAREFLEMILMDHLIHRGDKTWSYERVSRNRNGQHENQEIIFEVEAVTPA